MRDKFAPFIFRQLHGLKLIKLAGLVADYVKQSDVDQIVETGRSGQEVRQFGVPIDYFWSRGLSIIRTGSNAKLLVMGVPIEPSENQKPQTLENS
jgi:hypothetical protein